jgi:hypothetical protein
MTTTDTVRGSVQARDESEFPLLAAYQAVIREHSDPHRSIHEPSGGVDTMFAAREALARIGRPARDTEDVKHALAFVRQLEAEIASQAPKPPRTIRDLVIDAVFPLAGCVPDAAGWLAMTEQDQFDLLDEVVEHAGSDESRRFLAEALHAAMPTILAQISSEDEARRRRARLATVNS